MKPVVYAVRALPGGVPAEVASRVELRGGDTRPAPRERIHAEAGEAEILVVTYLDRVDDALLDGLPGVRQVSSYGVGLNHVDLQATARRGLVVTNTPDVLTDATADMAMALLLAAARRVCEGDRLIRAGGWRDAGPDFLLGREVTGKTLGIVGFGRIGQAMARRAAGFGMRILYTGPRDAGVPGTTRTDLDVLLATSDFVSLHCPLTDSTRDLISRERIARMKPGAVLINTSRGPVVDEEALADALEEGRLFAAGLDVFRDEPRVPERLRSAENAVLTPHVGSGTVETRTAMARMVWDEVLRRVTGRPPAHPVVI
ncbi:MAG: D-isomer specific 2-hydroxyacid dehydrogenase NAD-binding [Anaeromyxobacteraceae bacterium]|nr:D-isomer specific 2-hydroxyacid dehydrogenase NAD-binding [Anaeromyxobacteraceae bacterium]